MEQRNSSRKGCQLNYTHCEQCGRKVDPWMCEDGYTQCCNELVGYPGECRNHHGEEDEEYPAAPEVPATHPAWNNVKPAKASECSVHGCSNKIDRRGMCRKHANESK